MNDNVQLFKYWWPIHVCVERCMLIQQLIMIYLGETFCAYIGACTINNKNVNFNSIWDVLHD